MNTFPMSYTPNPVPDENLILESLKREQRLVRTLGGYGVHSTVKNLAPNRHAIPEYSFYYQDCSQLSPRLEPDSQYKHLPTPRSHPRANLQNGPINCLEQNGGVFYPATLIPPPTPYRDTFATKSDSIYNWPRRNRNHSNLDVLEIKRPLPATFKPKESECGLTQPYDLIPPCVPTNDKVSENSTEKYDIFDLPEVYNPPPLRSPLGKPRTGLMPSFYETQSCPNAKNNRKTKPLFPVFSEPIYSMNSNGEKITKYSLANNRPNCLKSTGPPETTKSDFNKRNAKSTPNFQLLTEHHLNLDDLHKNEDFNRPDISASAGGDNEDTALAKSVKLPAHNCLSPRAKFSRPLQPSMMNLQMAESLTNDAVFKLKSGHWEENFEGFSQIFNLTEVHASAVKEVLNKIIWYGLPHLSSPRTKLARMACLCFGKLFQTQKRGMEGDGERIFYKLLDLCGGSANSFIQQESREALVAAVENLDPLKSLSFLELHGARHKNPHVREFSAYLLSAIVDEVSQNTLMNKEFSPRLIPMIVGFLREGLQQTRQVGAS